MKIRKASEADAAFLSEAIIEAEKSGSEVLSYSRIFGLSDDEFKAMLPEMLLEDIEGQELCISGFLIAEYGNQPVAAVCGWIEAESGLSSGQLKASLLMQYFDARKMQHALAVNPILEKVHISRKPGALQLESVYTSPLFRGRGLAATLINEHISRRSAKNAEIILSARNLNAIRAYEKAGFTKGSEKYSDHPDILNYLPHNGKILLQKQL